MNGYKLIEYDEIPEFDQLTQGVFQGEVSDKGDVINVSVEVRDIEVGDDEEFEGDIL